jgi:hypothetical protein
MDLINRGYDDFEQKIMDDHAGIKVFMQPFYVFHKLDALCWFHSFCTDDMCTYKMDR